ncbi:MAG: hypothetical protein ACRDTV_05795 [Mycobacterium sp.]
MITSTVRSRSVLAHDRLDAHFFTSAGVAAHERLAVVGATGAVESVTQVEEIADVWDPPRFARAYAAAEEPSKPYLRPYDVFDYLPAESDRLSVLRNEDVDRLAPRVGTLLQTCSGRNLGPVTMADEDIAAFALSHDMIRIEAKNEEDRCYLLAFLKTPTGQALLRRGRSGSVIDHITTRDVQSLPLPIVVADVRKTVVDGVRAAVTASAAARTRLRRVQEAQEQRLPTPRRNAADRNGWTLPSRQLRDRLDAASYDPRIRAAVDQVRETDGVRCGDLAVAFLPHRYKRYYVEPAHGRPILSGRQLLQPEPINLRYVSDRSFKVPADYELRAGMTVFGAVGRSEGRQGTPALITNDRDGWLASNDVMRLTPQAGVSPAALWLAIAAGQTRIQINALSFGSVVDHMNPWDVEDLWIPTVDDDLVAEAEQAWRDFSVASSVLAASVASLEAALS